MMGSRVNAYLNVDFYLNWLLTQRFGTHHGRFR